MQDGEQKGHRCVPGTARYWEARKGQALKLNNLYENPSGKKRNTWAFRMWVLVGEPVKEKMKKRIKSLAW